MFLICQIEFESIVILSNENQLFDYIDEEVYDIENPPGFLH